MAAVYPCTCCQTFKCLGLRVLLNHIYTVHSQDLNFKTTCIVPTCSLVFCKYNSLYKHVVKNHKDLYCCKLNFATATGISSTNSNLTPSNEDDSTTHDNLEIDRIYPPSNGNSDVDVSDDQNKENVDSELEPELDDIYESGDDDNGDEADDDIDYNNQVITIQHILYLLFSMFSN